MAEICCTTETHSHICTLPPPNFDVDSDDVVGLIRNATRELERLNAAIATLNEQRSVQEAYLEHLQRTRARLSVRDLPPEVLSVVLHFALGDNLPLPSALPLVCRTWSRVFRDTHERWSNLPSLPFSARQLREEDFLRVFSLYIKRSGSRPLGFAIRDLPSQRVKHFMETKLFPLVHVIADRISVLELDSVPEVIRALTSSPTTFSSARTLRLEIKVPRSSSQREALTFKDVIPSAMLPNLTQFSSLSVTGRNGMVWGSWPHPNLSELKLAMDRAEDLFSALADFPNVVAVFLSGNWSLSQRVETATFLRFLPSSSVASNLCGSLGFRHLRPRCFAQN